MFTDGIIVNTVKYYRESLTVASHVLVEVSLASQLVLKHLVAECKLRIVHSLINCLRFII